MAKKYILFSPQRSTTFMDKILARKPEDLLIDRKKEETVSIHTVSRSPMARTKMRVTSSPS